MEKTLHKVGVGLGWDPNANGGENFDLDASAFMLGKNKQQPRLPGRRGVLVRG